MFFKCVISIYVTVIFAPFFKKIFCQRRHDRKSAMSTEQSPHAHHRTISSNTFCFSSMIMRANL